MGVFPKMVTCLPHALVRSDRATPDRLFPLIHDTLRHSGVYLQDAGAARSHLEVERDAQEGGQTPVSPELIEGTGDCPPLREAES